MKRILSTLLVAVMLFGTIVGLIPASTVRVYAASGEDEGYMVAVENAVTKRYKSIKDKLDNDKSMQLRLAVTADNGDVYKLYANQYTGEVIYYNEATGEAITTNPYDLCGLESAENVEASERRPEISLAVKERLMSQVVVSYKGKDGASKTMYSFTDAARNGQISIKPIATGIRVQYTIGRENATYLMPAWITTDRFEEEIVTPLNDYMAELQAALELDPLNEELTEAIVDLQFNIDKLTSDGATYTLFDPNKFAGAAEGTTEHALLLEMQSSYPITAKTDPVTGKFYAIWTVADDLVPAQKKNIETLVRTYCPDYTYEDLEADNAFTGYVSKEETPPLFKLSLEYTINKEDGSLDIRLPANSILYDETLFQLESISTLNYMGAGHMSESTYDSYYEDHEGTVWDDANAFPSKKDAYEGNRDGEYLMDGYVFYPDGSGAIFEFNDLYTKTNKPNVFWSGKIYGQDYAYYTVTGKNQEAIRLPVYGVVSTTSVSHSADYKDISTKQSGFLAILEEGEAMTNLAVAFGATTHHYASVYPIYYPRPKDTYDLADSISVSGNTEWTVVADRKYTGSYRTRVIMLSEDPSATYAPSWVGMATAYRDYLKGNGVLNPITAEAVKEQIPLYIEAFGAYETTKQILSMPVDVKVPLTSFEDIMTIYNDLSTEEGIYNINFKLTGFANGGMLSTYPAKLKWEKAVGGKSGFRDLIALAEEKDFGVYPEFDFSYISNEAAFDGVSLKGLGARTVDNRYCSKQIYDAVYQQFTSYFDMCVSTNLIAKYYEKFSDKLSEYHEDGSFGLSVGTLGSDLNSNFDEDNPINREEAKEDIVKLLGSMKDSYKTLMINSGNSYALGYADHILNMPLTGSNFRYASASVPFMAMVLHGYVNYTGSPINMAGDTAFNLLKLIENGAYPYFQLSYNTENTMLLKKDEVLNKYYSIRYDIWRWADPDNKDEGDGEIVRQYKKLNEYLAELQRAEMVDHAFIIGERKLQPSEIAANKLALKNTVLAAVAAKIADSEAAFYNNLSGALTLRDTVAAYDADIYDYLQSTDAQRTVLEQYFGTAANGLAGLTPEQKNDLVEAYLAGDDYTAVSGNASLKALIASVDGRIKPSSSALRTAIVDYLKTLTAVSLADAERTDVANAYLGLNGKDLATLDETVKDKIADYDDEIREVIVTKKGELIDDVLDNPVRGLTGLNTVERDAVKAAYISGAHQNYEDIDETVLVDLQRLVAPHDATIAIKRDNANSEKKGVLDYLKGISALASLTDADRVLIAEAYVNGNGLDDLSDPLKALLTAHDADLTASVVAGRRAGVISFLKRTTALSSYEAYFDKVADAYSVGTGLEDLKVLRALEVEINVSFESLWENILVAVHNNEVFNAAELADLKAEVSALLASRLMPEDVEGTQLYTELASLLGVTKVAPEDIAFFYALVYSDADADAIVATASQFTVEITDTAKLTQLVTASRNAMLYNELAAILGGNLPTAEDIDLFNMLIYSDADRARIEAAASRFSKSVADPSALADLVMASRNTKNTMLLLVTDVALEGKYEYDFNTTESSAEDGKDYVETDYTLKDERIVLVTYRKPDGTEVRFVLNYNIFDVKVSLDGKQYDIKSYDWVRVDPN